MARDITTPESTAGPSEAQTGAFGALLRHVPALDSAALQDYRWLWLSSFLSFMAMGMLMMSRSWVILRITDDSPLALAFVTVSFALPVILVSVVGGALADRIPRKRMLIIGQSGNAVATLVVATLDITGVIAFWHLLASGLVNGSMMAITMPSRQAMVADIVPEHKLMNGMALLNSGSNLTRILGPAAAGVMIGFIGTAVVFYVVAGVYALSVLTIMVLKAGRTPKARSGKGMAGDIREGLRYASGNPILLGLIVLVFIPVLFGMSYFLLLPAWAREVLNVEADNLGFLMMTMGLGALAGSLMLASLTSFQRKGALLLVCCAAWGVGLAVFSQSTSYAVAVPLLLFIGVASSVFMSLNMTLIQLNTSPEMRGRVTSIAAMSFGVMPLSVLPFGVIAQSFGTDYALWLSGLLLLAFTAVFMVAYPRFWKIR